MQLQNNDFICVEKNELIDYVTTSGTLGNPVTFALTENDLERLAYNEALSFSCVGITENDIIQITTTLDRCFMTGMAYFLGARKLKAGVIRVGSGLPELQWEIIKRLSPTVIIGVPSFILKIIEYAENQVIDYNNSSIKKAICIGESIRNPDFTFNTLGRRIKEKWDIALYSTYASTEMSTAFTECSEGKGGHLLPELIIAEVLDENDNPVKEGEHRELTITTLGVQGMPLLRFKTGDICVMHSAPCKCGRKTPRIGPILGRRKQMIKYKGTTFYPAAIANVLYEIDEVQSFVTEIFKNNLGMDDVLIHIHFSGGLTIQEKIQTYLKSKLRISVSLNLT